MASIPDNSTNSPEQAAPLAEFGVAFAKGLAAFLAELQRRGMLQPGKCAVGDAARPAADEPPADWSQLPVDLRRQFEDELARNRTAHASGELSPIEFDEAGVPTAIANRLRQVADVRGVTQKELAQRLNVSPSVINKVFRHPERSKLTTLRKLAAALNVDLRDII